MMLAATPLALAVAALAAVAAHFISSTLAASALTGAAIAAIPIGLGAVAGVASRAVRPFAALGRTVEQFGRGDLAVRAHLTGSAEVQALASRFNEMAEQIEESRRISLGERVCASLAAEAALNSLPDPVFVFDPEGEILSLNRAARELLSPAGRAQPSLYEIDPALRAALDTARWHVLRGKGSLAPRTFEEAVAPSGRPRGRCYLPRAEPVYGPSGSIAAATVLLQDVTRLHGIDELRSDFALGVAQRFRTPLTSMLMVIHLCLEGSAGAISDEQQHLLLTAREECERLQAAVDELIDLARFQAAALPRQQEREFLEAP